MENGLLKTKEEIRTLLKARTGLVWLETAEEIRAEQMIFELAYEMDYEVRSWSSTRGLEKLIIRKKEKDKPIEFMPNPEIQVEKEDPYYPNEALKDMYSRDDGRFIMIMRDLSAQMAPNNLMTGRALRDFARFTAGLETDQTKAVIIIDAKRPPEDITEMSLLDLPLPGKESVEKILDNALKNLDEAFEEGEKKKAEEKREEIVSAALGLPAEFISISILKSFFDTKTIDPASISKDKKQIVSKKGTLEWYDPDPSGFDLIGGLEALKQWLIQRKAGFSDAAREYGLPIPKGMLMVGVPGCGKSLSAKCTAAAWNVPLLRLDVGAIFGGLVGESESNIREAIKTAEAIAPAVLWVDEIEKGFAGSVSGAASDGGTASRVFSTMLTWLQEKTEPVFVIATANQIKELPPEFLRAGRWDDIFFVDLPNEEERVAICEVFKSRYKVTSAVDPQNIAKHSEGFSGAELEAAWTSAMYACFQNDKQVETMDVLEQLGIIVPQIKSQGAKIKDLRDWANGNARMASVVKQKTTTMKGRLD